MPKKIIGQMNMKWLVERYAALGAAAEVFSNPDEVMEWLDNQK